MRRLAATEIKDHLGRKVQRLHIKPRINAPLVAIARIGVDFQSPASGRDLDVIPIGGLKEHIHGVLGAAGFQTTHNAANALDALIIGNDHMTIVKAVFFFIQPHQSLACRGAMHAQIAFDLIGIKDVQRAVAVIGEEVGDIDQSGDRTQANGLEAILKPLRRWAVFHAFDQATTKYKAAIFARVFVDCHGNRAVKAAFDLGGLCRLHLAQTTGRQIQSHAAHAQRVRTVRRDRDFDHWIDFGRIVFRQPIHEFLTDVA